MLSTQALVPALVLLSLFLAASAIPTAPADTNEKTNEVEIVPSPSTRKGAALKREIDYRKSSCMPPFTEEFTYLDFYKTYGCLYGSWALSAASLAEYVECKSLKLKTPRDFSVRQLLECVILGSGTDGIACNYPHVMPDQGVFSYIFYKGLTLKPTYLAGKAGEFPMGPGNCDDSNSVTAFQFKKGFKTIKQNDEYKMAKILAKEGKPIIATLYFKEEYVRYPVDEDNKELWFDYKSGILDHEKVCLEDLSALKFGDSLYKASMMVVGYRQENGVNVWILRNDWFGASWGMGGYFYMKRGVNACHIALNAFHVLD